MSSAEERSLVYTKAFQRHVKLVPAKYHALIRQTLEQQLKYDAEVKTRNRKPLKKPFASRRNGSFALVRLTALGSSTASRERTLLCLR